MAFVQVLGLSPGLFTAKEPIPGQVHVLHGSRVMNCLHKSAPDYAGVTGLFPVSLTLQEEDATVAVVISFASGSRALTTGVAAHTPPDPHFCDHIFTSLLSEDFLDGGNSCMSAGICHAGDTFSDVTESIGLDAEAQTLTAATISPGCMAQVSRLCLIFCFVVCFTEHPFHVPLPCSKATSGLVPATL